MLVPPSVRGSSWIAGLQGRARTALAPALFEYLAQGAREGISAGEALESWRSVRLLPQVLRDVTTVDPGVDLLGERSEIPWGVAPTSLQCLIHPDGEVAMASATAEAGGVLVVSSNAGRSFADIGGTGVRWWLQVYLPADRSLAEPMLARAVEAGASAVVLTVDTPVVGTKHIETGPVWSLVRPGQLRSNFDPGYDELPGAEKALDLGPQDLDWLAEHTGLPVVVKGVLRADDARRCVQAGASAVWVSNHGGRQLDRVASTAVCLPEVVAAVGGDVEVYVDGGIESGLDVVTALALGAHAVFVGRTAAYALVDGASGVRRLHAELLAETVEALRLAGCRRAHDAPRLLLSGPENPF